MISLAVPVFVYLSAPASEDVFYHDTYFVIAKLHAALALWAVAMVPISIVTLMWVRSRGNGQD
jgi:hypothetical protein